MLISIKKLKEKLHLFYNHKRECIILITVIVLSLSLIVLFYFFKSDLSYNENGREYLLSSISQGLAASFALIFTITLVLVQLTAKYSPRIFKFVFSRLVIIYMLFFVFSIIFPLYVLISISDFGVKLSLIFAVLCFVFLIPYTYRIGQKINPISLMKTVKKEFDKKLTNKSKLDISSSLDLMANDFSCINNFCVYAISTKDYPTLEKGLEIYKDMLWGYHNRLKDILRQATIIPESLEDFCIQQENNFFGIEELIFKERNTVYIFNEVFRKKGKEVLELRDSYAVNDVIRSFGSMCYAGIKQNDEIIARWGIVSGREIFLEALKKEIFVEEAHIIQNIRSVIFCGAEFYRKKWLYRLVLEYLKEINEITGNGLIEQAYVKSIKTSSRENKELIPKINAFFREFETSLKNLDYKQEM